MCLLLCALHGSKVLLMLDGLPYIKAVKGHGKGCGPRIIGLRLQRTLLLGQRALVHGNIWRKDGHFRFQLQSCTVACKHDISS